MIKENSFIEIKNLNKTFNGDGLKFPALKNINLKINKGDFVLISGKSGSGKSTLLNMVSGIDYPSSGEVWIDETPIHSFGSNELAKWRGVNIGIVFQFFQLMPTLNVLENIMLPMEFANVIAYSKQKILALDLLQKLDIKNLSSKMPNTLSGGEKQRVAIARALANNPPVIIADEPTGNLDSANSQIIHQLFNSLSAKGKTILYVTHEKDTQVAFNRLIRVTDGNVEELYN